MKQETLKRLILKYEQSHMFEVKSMDEFTEKVVDNTYPVIVMLYEK